MVDGYKTSRDFVPEPSIPRENWTAQDELIGAWFFLHFPELGKLTHIHAYPSFRQLHLFSHMIMKHIPQLAD
jgi:hypothetical protein